MATVEMANTITVFVSYSHQDAGYLENHSLLGYLKGLATEGVAFWTDREIQGGELWDDVIKAKIQEADIALVLVSQWFLDSAYCRNVEIQHCLAQQKHLFPIILSPCEWRRHEWLSGRQCLPGGDQTLEEHYPNPGLRKGLFLKIREQLRHRAAVIRQAAADRATPLPAALQTRVRRNQGRVPPHGKQATIGEQSAGVAPCRTSLAAALTGTPTERNLRSITRLRGLNFLVLKGNKQDLNPLFPSV